MRETKGGTTMKLSRLISQRKALQSQTRLANLAYAYQHLDRLIGRIDRAQLRGLVRLEPRDLAAERCWPVMTALEGSQSVVEEHFTDGDIADLADLLAFETGREDSVAEVRLEELRERFLAPLAGELVRAGVQLESGPRPKSAPERGGTSRR
jgi:hypothetical protein